MFIGYLRNDFEKSCERLVEHNKLFDLQLLKHTYESFPQYCFAAYEENQIVGLISAYAFEKYLYINVFEVIDSDLDIRIRLMELLLKNINHDNLFCLLESKLFSSFEAFGFQVYDEFVRYMHSGEAVAFNFSNSLARQVSSNDYEAICVDIDKRVFNDNRVQYIAKDATFSNSLKLATQSGFLHSYVINKRYIRMSPWLMKPEAFIEAEKLLRGVLYYRGLKKIFAYAPKNVAEICKLYESYKFKKDGVYKLVYLGEKPNFALDELYAI